jgi:hypothetical protein
MHLYCEFGKKNGDLDLCPPKLPASHLLSGTLAAQLLPAACCLLPAACCLLPAACCLLPAACCRTPHEPFLIRSLRFRQSRSPPTYIPRTDMRPMHTRKGFSSRHPQSQPIRSNRDPVSQQTAQYRSPSDKSGLESTPVCTPASSPPEYPLPARPPQGSVSKGGNVATGEGLASQ